MHPVPPEGGETIFEMLGPYDSDKFGMSEVHTIGDEVGSFALAEEE